MSEFLFAHEMEWVKQELNKVEKRLKELGLELDEAMDQSTETFHDNGPAEVIRDEAGTYWQKRSWLLGLQTHKLKPLPQNHSYIQSGHQVELKAKTHALTIQLGHIVTYPPTEMFRMISEEAPVYKLLLGKKEGDEITLGKTDYIVARITLPTSSS